MKRRITSNPTEETRYPSSVTRKDPLVTVGPPIVTFRIDSLDREVEADPSITEPCQKHKEAMLVQSLALDLDPEN